MRRPRHVRRRGSSIAGGHRLSRCDDWSMRSSVAGLLVVCDRSMAVLARTSTSVRTNRTPAFTVRRHPAAGANGDKQAACFAGPRAGAPPTLCVDGAVGVRSDACPGTVATTGPLSSHASVSVNLARKGQGPVLPSRDVEHRPGRCSCLSAIELVAIGGSHGSRSRWNTQQPRNKSLICRYFVKPAVGLEPTTA